MAPGCGYHSISGMVVVERMGVCPRCSKPVKLTEDELIHKRATCLLCDATFDVSPSDLGALPPYRAEPLVVRAPDSVMMPGLSENLTTGELELSPPGGQGSLAVGVFRFGFPAFFALAAMLWMMPRAFHHWPGYFIILLMPVIAGAGIAWQRTRRELLRVEAGSLWIIRRALGNGRTERIPLDDIMSLEVREEVRVVKFERSFRYWLRIVRRTGDSRVGHDLGLGPHAMNQVKEWVANRLGDASKRLGSR